MFASLTLWYLLQGPVMADPKRYVPFAHRPVYRNFRQIAHEAASRSGHRLSRAGLQALQEIAYRESKFNPHAQSKRTSAYGLYGFLNSTWRSTGVKKTSDPTTQTVAALKYIKRRYGTPEKALEFHKKKGYY